ncbi:MAG TPA: hypothetical protein VLA43_20360, partial [Longimicrobiales bacterium]|nr:hypothetical protein [Longimicrobiales bacterium]
MRRLAPEGEGRGELLRKALHMGTGGGALLLHWTGWWGGLALAGAGVLFNALLLHRVTGGRLLRTHERETGWSWGVVAYPGMVLLVVLCLPGRLELAAGAWGILAFGDGAAGLVGRYVGGPSLPWNPRKRWWGLVAFVAVGAPVAALLVRWTQMGGAAGVGASFVVSTGGGTPWLLVGCTAAAVVAGLFESLDSV